MRGSALFAAIGAALAALFLFAPGLDLAVSRLFYDSGSGFFLAGRLPVKLIEGAIPWLVGLIVVIVLVGAAWLLLAGRPLWRLDRAALMFLVAATALGPGLIVNTLLKDHWGRARPYQIAEFGGVRQFTPAPLPAAQCERNCAFVSGHAALGFSLVSFALLLPWGRRRQLAVAAALGVGMLVGLARIAAGRHFLSDVAFAGWVICATSWLLYRWIVVGAGARHLYGAIGTAARGAAAYAARLYRRPASRLGLWAAAVAIGAAAAIGWIDRPLAWHLHMVAAAWRPLFEPIGRLGFAMPYLVLFAAAFAALRCGGAVRRLRRWAGWMQTAARVPAFLFAAVAASGLIVDLLKLLVGRTRPKLLFASGDYDFSWFGLTADHWSFPSGHAATAAALMTALWCLWPRHVLFYIALAALIAVSRVVIGAHYLSDVLMGGFIGVVATRIAAAAFARGGLGIAWRPRAPAEPLVPPP
jgi:lipid A 4'-phosphatase